MVQDMVTVGMSPEEVTETERLVKTFAETLDEKVRNKKSEKMQNKILENILEKNLDENFMNSFHFNTTGIKEKPAPTMSADRKEFLAKRLNANFLKFHCCRNGRQFPCFAEPFCAHSLNDDINPTDCQHCVWVISKCCSGNLHN